MLPVNMQKYMEELFGSCPDEIRSSMKVMTVEANELFIEAGTRCDRIYIILEGKARGLDMQMQDRIYAFKEFYEGSFFGELETFSDIRDYRVSIETAARCTLLVLPASAYLRWMKNDARALFIRTRDILSRLTYQTGEERKYLFLDCRDRMMLLLTERYERAGTSREIRIRQTRDELSDETGFCVKTLNRTIKKLKEEGFIGLQAGKIVVGKEHYKKMKDYTFAHLISSDEQKQ